MTFKFKIIYRGEETGRGGVGVRRWRSYTEVGSLTPASALSYSDVGGDAFQIIIYINHVVETRHRRVKYTD